MGNVSQENKTIASTAAAVFGGEASVFRYRDDNGKRDIGILSCKGSPVSGVTSYATIGLSDTPLYKGGVEYPVRVEIVGACADAYEEFANVLGTAAFNIINSGWSCYPGAIFPDVIAMYALSPTMRHFMFVPPFLWEGGLQTLRFDNKTVTWLLAVPISQDEFQYAETNGSDKLEGLFEQQQIDVFDIERVSVV